MDPRAHFCPNPGCRARGQTAQATIKMQSKTERHWRGVEADRDGSADQHVVHRAVQRDVPVSAAVLVRCGRGLARKMATLESGMYLMGCVYNFCTEIAASGCRLQGERPRGMGLRQRWPLAEAIGPDPCGNSSASGLQPSVTVECGATDSLPWRRSSPACDFDSTSHPIDRSIGWMSETLPSQEGDRPRAARCPNNTARTRG